MGQLFGAAAGTAGAGLTEGGITSATSAGSLAGIQSGAGAAAGSTSLLGPIGLGIMAVGTGLSMYGDIQVGKTAAAVGKYNKNVAEMQAAEIERKTAFDNQRLSEEGERTISNMEVGQAAAGGGMNLLAFAKQASENELKMLMNEREGSIAAGQARAEGAMANWQGKVAKKQSYLKAGATALQGFGGAMA